MLKHTFKGGVHPMHSQHEGKLPTRNLPVRTFVPETVCIQMGMHLGAPSKPCVKKGDRVLLGQVIGEPVGGLGLPVHASVSGEVLEVAPKQQLGAGPVMCVTIKNDFLDEWIPDRKPLGDVEAVAPEAIVPAIKNAGICGLGGASFPTHVKLTPPQGTYCDTLILNGAECETFLTADYRLMLESPKRVVDGLRAAMRALGVKKGIIAIEDNKMEAVESIQKAAQGREGVEVKVLKTKYPQGGEKQLIQAVTGRQVPSGKLPIDVHTIVINVATAAAITDAIVEGKPLIDRIVTVSGAVKEPANLLLRIGTVFSDIINECGGYVDEPGKIAVGGGMTGICVPHDGVSLLKANNGIIVYSEKESKALEEGPCIRCGRCVDACPVGLSPYILKYHCDADRQEEAEALNVMDCILCGSCSYVCPARRWLTASFKNTKDKITLRKRREANK